MKSCFWEFGKSREYIRNLEIKTSREYYLLKKPEFIPSNPRNTYKKQWLGWNDWLGTKKKEEFLSFKDARDYVRKIGLRNKKQWKVFCKKDRPLFIPSNPNAVYREWVGFPDWMGYDWDVHCNKKYHANERFFKKWSHEMAYVLGFWFADGYIHNGLVRGKRTRYVFGITQCEKKILEDILRVMESDYPIHAEKHQVGATSYRFFIESKKIVDDIIKMGGSYKKSLTSKFPYVPKKYLPDFIRGVWDGDGSAFTGSRGACATFSCGSKVFVDEFVRCLKVDAGILNPCVVRDKRRRSAYNITLCPNDARRLGSYIYNGGRLYLERKKDIFDSFGEICPSTRDIGRNFLDFNSAHKKVMNLGFSRWKQWVRYCKSGNRLSNIPSNPSKTYLNNGWKDWRYWLTGRER